jgi:hypothetical protein
MADRGGLRVDRHSDRDEEVGQRERLHQQTGHHEGEHLDGRHRMGMRSGSLSSDTFRWPFERPPSIFSRLDYWAGTSHCSGRLIAHERPGVPLFGDGGRGHA